MILSPSVPVAEKLESLSGRQAAPVAAMDLEVLTLNCWGLWLVAKQRARRLRCEALPLAVRSGSGSSSRDLLIQVDRRSLEADDRGKLQLSDIIFPPSYANLIGPCQHRDQAYASCLLQHLITTNEAQQQERRSRQGK